MSKVIAARRFALRESDLDPFSVVNQLICPAAVRDRFGILNKYSPINWSNQTDEIPTAFTEHVALGTIMDERMAEILAKYSSGKVVVAWSGGVDSTAVICAYLRSGAPLDRLTIVCTEDSIEEYPLFYELLRKLGVNINIAYSVTDELSDVECEVILTGCCGDQLFGSVVNTHNVNLYNEPWVDALRTYAYGKRKVKLSNRSLEILEAVYTDYGKNLGVEIEQWCEFLWMMNFGCKWTFMQHGTNLSLAGTPNYGKAVAFFEDIKFQRWAVTRFPSLRERNPHTNVLTYKAELKQYILNYTADRTYFQSKGKMATRTWRSSELDFVSVLTEDGVRKFEPVDYRGCLGCIYRTVGDMFRKEPLV